MIKRITNQRLIQMAALEKARGDLPVMVFKHQTDWEAWLGKHFDSSPGIWMRLAKKSATLQSVTYQEALEWALCYGWIDGQKKAFDKESWLQRFTPRGPKSIWSRINHDKALRLIKSRRMKPAGLAAIRRAKENGRWDAAYDSHSTAVPPPDFQEALNKNARAKNFFATLNSQNRYAILFRIQTVKKIETRQKRIAAFVRMLGMHEKLHP